MRKLPSLDKVEETQIHKLIAPPVLTVFIFLHFSPFLVKDCQLSVKQVNPRQYVAQIPQVRFCEGSTTIAFNFIFFIIVCLGKSFLFCLVRQLPNTEVWFQRPKDIVRKLLSGDLDLGIVGLDIVSEFGQVNDVIYLD